MTTTAFRPVPFYKPASADFFDAQGKPIFEVSMPYLIANSGKTLLAFQCELNRLNNVCKEQRHTGEVQNVLSAFYLEAQDALDEMDTILEDGLPYLGLDTALTRFYAALDAFAHAVR